MRKLGKGTEIDRLIGHYSAVCDILKGARSPKARQIFTALETSITRIQQARLQRPMTVKSDSIRQGLRQGLRDLPTVISGFLPQESTKVQDELTKLLAKTVDKVSAVKKH